eukprot:jgi/Mesvir1/18601/Mv17110-RA.1
MVNKKTRVDAKDPHKRVKEAPACTEVGEYLRSYHLRGKADAVPLTSERTDCAKGVSSRLTREQAVKLASRLHPNLPSRALETATKSDLCALIADEMVENITRALCTANLAQNADSKTRIALTASSLSKMSFESVADLSRESLSLAVGAMLNSEQRACALRSGDAPGILEAIPWRKIGEGVDQFAARPENAACTPKCLVDLLHLIGTLLSSTGSAKEKAVRDNLSMLTKASLTHVGVWKTLAAMGGGVALESSLRGLAGAKNAEEARKSAGGRAALTFYNTQMDRSLANEHSLNQCNVAGGVNTACVGAVMRRHSLRSACIQRFLKSNRSRVYDASVTAATPAHAAKSACIQMINPKLPTPLSTSIPPPPSPPPSPPAPQPKTRPKKGKKVVPHPVKSACIQLVNPKLPIPSVPAPLPTHAVESAKVAGPDDGHIKRLLFTASPTSCVGQRSACTLCG